MNFSDQKQLSAIILSLDPDDTVYVKERNGTDVCCKVKVFKFSLQLFNSGTVTIVTNNDLQTLQKLRINRTDQERQLMRTNGTGYLDELHTSLPC